MKTGKKYVNVISVTSRQLHCYLNQSINTHLFGADF
jgi:hypothetical protein